MSIYISPSIMCCQFEDYNDYISSFENKRVKNIHFDVMDGHYVKNIMLGTNTYKELKSKTNLPIDLHFMCNNPEDFIEYFSPQNGDWVCFHPETTNHPHRLLQKIKSLGCRAGYAINPGTPLSYIEEVLDELDYILIMAVNPGFAGQTMVDSHLDKLKRIKEMVNSADRNIDLVIDGNTTIENAKKMVNAGATGLVVGTSSLLKSVEVFNEEYENYLEAVSNLKESQ